MGEEDVLKSIGPWGPLPWPLYGPHVPFGKLKFPTPQDDSCELWLKSDYMPFQKEKPPPPPPPR